MIVVGCTNARTRDGTPLIDGGACVLVDGRCVAAVAEERVSRRKHAAGCEMAITAVLSSAGLRVADVGLWVTSSCLEPVLDPRAPMYVSADRTLADLGVPPERVTVCDHHRAHGLFAFLASPFERALVIVADGAGNALGSMEVGDALFDTVGPDGPLPGRWGKRYWDGPLVRHSHALGVAGDLELLGVDPPDPPYGGAGDVYWAFTRLVGFGSYSQAGKTMGLAAYGRQIRGVPPPITFDPRTGAVAGAFPLDGLAADQPLVAWLAAHGHDVRTRLRDEPILPAHEDLARLVQDALEAALVAKAVAWSSRVGERRICLAGGVALNSVANGRIAALSGVEVDVAHAPGDTGQCVGNALHGALLVGDPIDRASIRDPFLGPLRPPWDGGAVPPGMRARRVDVVQEAAARLARGEVVGWFQGRSELGPRALGNRSLLAAPFEAATRDRINGVIKRRESFRPLAPSILEEAAADILRGPCPSPYMSFTAPVVAPGLHAITHVDGSARYQTVHRALTPRYHALLRAFHARTGTPVVLNTSLNRDGEPIVETPEEAVALFATTPIDAMFIDDIVLEREPA